MPEVGDQITATLLVEPYDASTQATLVANRPDGSAQAPTCSTSDGGRTWIAPLDLDLAGTWILKWTVVGMGGSVEYEEIGVGPGLTFADPDLRIYASTTDLAHFLRAAPPPGAAKLLEDASRRMSGILLTAVYATDADGMPSDPVQRRAIANATCALAEWWLEAGGDALGVDGDWASASAGSVSISRNPGATLLVGGRRIPWKAWNLLIEARVLPGAVQQR